MIWSPCLEEMEEDLVISTPTSSLDILPTLSNLFGLEYDSRLCVGTDVLAEGAETMVVWPNGTWLTDKGFYYSSKGEFTPSGEEEVSEDYIAQMNAIAGNKISFSSSVLYNDYFDYLFGKLGE